MYAYTLVVYKAVGVITWSKADALSEGRRCHKGHTFWGDSPYNSLHQYIYIYLIDQ